MEQTKPKKTALSIKDRCDILERLEKGETCKELAVEFKVTRQAINVIKKRSKHIENAKKVLENCGGDLDRKRYTGKEGSQLDQKLYEWFKQCQEMGLKLSGPMLKQQALLFNKTLGGKENFAASDGWLERFKRRHKIKYKIDAEKISEDFDTSEEFIKQKNIEGEKMSESLDTSEELIMKMRNIRDVTGIELDYIYNCDEAELYWKAEPNKTYITKQVEQGGGRKKAKNRLTVLLCTNASGTHKLPLFIIGKSAQPRCLQGIKHVPVWYTNQDNAWITCELMKKWYRSVFLPEIKKKHDLNNNPNRKIILLMDNAAYHPTVDQLHEMSESSTIIHIPSDVTSHIQPLNQLIIEKFKRCYKKRFIEKLLIEDTFCSGKIFLDSFNLLDCFHFCQSAWNDVTPNDIKNSWKALLPFESDCSSSPDVQLIDARTFHSLIVKIPAYKNVSIKDVNDWLSIESEEVGWEPRSNDDIIYRRHPDDNTKDTVEELDDVVAYEDQNWTPTDSILDNSCPTYIEAFVGLNTFLKWYKKKGGSSELGHQCFVTAHEELTKIVLDERSASS